MQSKVFLYSGKISESEDEEEKESPVRRKRNVLHDSDADDADEQQKPPSDENDENQMVIMSFRMKKKINFINESYNNEWLIHVSS